MGAWRGLRSATRLTLCLGHLLLGALWVNALLFLDPQRGRRGAAAWCRLLLRLLGVRCQASGAPAPGALLVANHLSWLDIVVLYGQLPETFLSKAELRGWPIVGAASARLGTLFIGRGEAGAADRAAREMADRLRAGERVIFFPEGRIGTGGMVQPFRPRLLRAAEEASARVQPVALEYATDGGSSREGPLGGMIPERSVLGSAWWVAGRRVRVRVAYLEPVWPGTLSRRELAETCRGRIAEALELEERPGRALPPRERSPGARSGSAAPVD